MKEDDPLNESKESNLKTPLLRQQSSLSFTSGNKEKAV
jgi:hypothetical protein